MESADADRGVKMKPLSEKMKVLAEHIGEDKITVMILGLGSVGSYLLDYLVSRNDPAVRIVAVGRNREKMESDINIVRVGALIRRQNRSVVLMEAGVDFDDVSQTASCIEKHRPDFIVNTSRVYPGLKYGSISWKSIRAYGLWSPLAVKYIKIL